MAAYRGLEAFAINMRAGKRALVEQGFLNVSRQSIPVPNAEMKGLVAPEEQSFQVERRKCMVEARQPLRHTHVISVFGFELKLKEAPGSCPQNSSAISRETAIGRDFKQSTVAIRNQAKGTLVACKG
jgi:hypothetical protein